MFNIDETTELKVYYLLQKDLYMRGFIYSVGVFLFIDLVRSQISEVNLLQLIPGFYLLLLFISFLFLMYFSYLFIRIPFQVDNQKSSGTKTLTKVELKVSLKLSLLLFLTELVLILNTVIPLSLECFNSYGEKTLENTWSLDEVISLEIILLVILLILSQVPLTFLGQLNTESAILMLPKYWRTVSFLIVLISGFLTPTIDGYTQISFAVSTLSLYLLLINFSEKRILIKPITRIIFGT